MEDDNVYPNDGSYFLPTEPQEQVNERRQEKAKIIQGKKVLLEVSERLQERIDFLGSVDAISAEVKTDPQKFLIIHNANELARNHLRSEKEYIDDLLDIAEDKGL